MTTLMQALKEGKTAVIEPGEYKPEQLQAMLTKQNGNWYGLAFLDLPDKRLIVSVAHGRKPKKVMREVMQKAIRTLIHGSEAGELTA